ncbi:MAG TPA: DUF998 domain-containing protein [Euzebyales bacterium]|nr:DUF998 domain-containing protein [Euzebyales bacterium]
MTHMTSSTRPASAPIRTVRTLLTCGIAAAPLYIAVVALQALVRDGFDIRRHAASLLSNGDLGWLQIANFVVTGLLTIAGAVGIRRALRGGRGLTRGPRLLGICGVATIAAGVFVADPAFGFPGGTPDGPPAAVSWHGVAHFVAAAVSFLALIAACFVFARRFAGQGRRLWAAYSATTGVLFFAAFAGIASGQQSSALNVVFAVAVVLGWTWISALSALLRRDVDRDGYAR